LADDESAAVGGQAHPDTIVGQPITATIPTYDDYLILGMPSSVRVVTGRGTSAQIFLLQEIHGIISSTAWCLGPQGTVYFLSRKGLYRVARGATFQAQNISRQRMPRELQEIDPATNSIFLIWDGDEHGVHIYVTPNEGRGKHWFFDAVWEAFYPDIYNRDHQPTCVRRVDILDGQLLLGGRDGVIRRYQRGALTDDGEPAISYVGIGPFVVWNEKVFGYIQGIRATLGQESGWVHWGLALGESPEEALRNDPEYWGVWEPGFNDMVSIGVPAAYAFLILYGGAEYMLNKDYAPMESGDGERMCAGKIRNFRPWAVETIEIDVERGGVIRK